MEKRHLAGTELKIFSRLERMKGKDNVVSNTDLQILQGLFQDQLVTSIMIYLHVTKGSLVPQFEISLDSYMPDSLVQTAPNTNPTFRYLFFCLTLDHLDPWITDCWHCVLGFCFVLFSGGKLTTIHEIQQYCLNQIITQWSNIYVYSKIWVIQA